MSFIHQIHPERCILHIFFYSFSESQCELEGRSSTSRPSAMGRDPSTVPAYSKPHPSSKSTPTSALGFLVSSGSPCHPQTNCDSCSAGAGPRVAPCAEGVRMAYPFIHAASPNTVSVKLDFGCRTQQRLILWVLARKMYSRQMWSNGFSRSMLCMCRYITRPSPSCCNCCFQKLMRQKC